MQASPGNRSSYILFNPDAAPVSAFMPSFETAARSLKVVPIVAPVHDDVEIETAIIALGRGPGGGLVVMPDTFTVVHRVPIISAVARNNIPAVYPRSDYARDGRLLSYGVDQVDTFRRAATYVDRVPVRSPANCRFSFRPSSSSSSTSRPPSARPYSTAESARGRRRGDRMRGFIAGLRSAAV